MMACVCTLTLQAAKGKKPYFIDHINRKTTWEDPRSVLFVEPTHTPSIGADGKAQPQKKLELAKPLPPLDLNAARSQVQSQVKMIKELQAQLEKVVLEETCRPEVLEYETRRAMANAQTMLDNYYRDAQMRNPRYGAPAPPPPAMIQQQHILQQHQQRMQQQQQQQQGRAVVPLSSPALVQQQQQHPSTLVPPAQQQAFSSSGYGMRTGPAAAAAAAANRGAGGPGGGVAGMPAAGLLGRTVAGAVPASLAALAVGAGESSGDDGGGVGMDATEPGGMLPGMMHDITFDDVPVETSLWEDVGASGPTAPITMPPKATAAAATVTATAIAPGVASAAAAAAAAVAAATGGAREIDGTATAMGTAGDGSVTTTTVTLSSQSTVTRAIKVEPAHAMDYASTYACTDESRVAIDGTITYC